MSQNFLHLLTAVATLGGIAFAYASFLALLNRWIASSTPGNDLLETVNSLLPQIQCAQCGYPGCRPYAEAMLRGEPTDLCPPGGEATAIALAEVLGRSVSLPQHPFDAELIATIREPECIGCALCLLACPVDAIVGAERFMHTVVEEHCTGCELCVPVCPVDCIDMVKP